MYLENTYTKIPTLAKLKHKPQTGKKLVHNAPLENSTNKKSKH